MNDEAMPKGGLSGAMLSALAIVDERDELRRQLAEARSYGATQSEMLARALNQVDELKADLADAEQRETSAMKALALSRDETHGVRAQAEKAARERDEAHGVITSIASKLAHLEADLHGALGRAAVLERGCTTLSGQLAAANEQVAELTEQLSKLEAGGRAA